MRVERSRSRNARATKVCPHRDFEKLKSLTGNTNPVSSEEGKMSYRTCCKKFSFIFALLAMAILAAPAFAQTCLQNEYNLVNKQKLNCTANDVRIAEVTNIRDPLTGLTKSSCIGGELFSFIADFKILTTSSQARENIGLYIATNSQTQALTGSCVDNI